MIAARWNDRNFTLVTKTMTCHPDFNISIDCSHAAVAALTPCTAIKAENLLTAWRSTLRRIIEKWETSGQGDGGHGEDGHHGHYYASLIVVSRSLYMAYI
jgi:hypothetical protein